MFYWILLRILYNLLGSCIRKEVDHKGEILGKKTNSHNYLYLRNVKRPMGTI